MSKYFTLLAAICLLLLVGASQLKAQSPLGSTPLPEVNIRDLKGKTVSAATLNNDGKPFVISFWATWCKPCILELNTLMDSYADWQDEVDFKLIAISIDDAQTSSKVASFVAGRGWDYEVYIDENSLLKQAFNITNVPHTLIVNGKGQVVAQRTGYVPGDEDHLLEEFKKLAGE